ncbi:MAG: metallophosphoesterase [Bacteroidetes bacterium]|nr:metallophosphoesterase [Bacteroidota bacterium]MBS1929997.1 metallophosphoesterase [Bacteroidota bacterium]
MKKLLFVLTPMFIFNSMITTNQDYPLSKSVIDPPQQVDGPFVMYRNDSILVKYLYQDGTAFVPQTEKYLLSQKDNIVLHVNTNEPGKTFSVKLKPKLSKEKSEFKKASRLFILSDIEGNFDAFRKLLQAGGVINQNFDWTFGKGDLVLIGDLVDRGPQVTEVLWLIYSLEEKAKAAGGYVHYILGNHEIMELSSDLRYLNEKYLQSTSALQIPYATLIGDNTEIGRWLRTKNVMEIVGDMLFVHGGISPEMNNVNLSIDRFNELARPFYADTTGNYPYIETELLYGENGPFWYRGYYTGKRIATDNQIDSTLDKFYVKHIVTGHTIMADTISIWHRGKLFDTDVHHAAGKSEALLVENKKFYRVNAKGEKIQIF